MDHLLKLPRDITSDCDASGDDIVQQYAAGYVQIVGMADGVISYRAQGGDFSQGLDIVTSSGSDQVTLRALHGDDHTMLFTGIGEDVVTIESFAVDPGADLTIFTQTQDDQVLGGMFVAIQDFVKDSFKDVNSFTLRKLEFGEKSILIEKGDHLFLAVILHGKTSRKVASKMVRIVDEIEAVFSPSLEEWDGDLDALRGVSDIAKKLYSKAPPPVRRCRAWARP